MDNEPAVKCVRESDGYHVHRYRVTSHPEGESPRPIIIELHKHTWMDEHRQTFPHAKDVSAHRRRGLDLEVLGDFDTVKEAWVELCASGDIPSITCAAEAQDEEG